MSGRWHNFSYFGDDPPRPEASHECWRGQPSGAVRWMWARRAFVAKASRVYLPFYPQAPAHEWARRQYHGEPVRFVHLRAAPTSLERWDASLVRAWSVSADELAAELRRIVERKRWNALPPAPGAEMLEAEILARCVLARAER